MAQDEGVLLQRFVRTGDAAAFSEIVRRYASLVYSACIRILGDRETAADAAQETFFQFLKKANTITGSIPAWLHKVATCKAVDRIRAESARERAEAQYADAKCRQAANWEDLSPYVDQALEAIDAPSRELLIEYYFRGRTLSEIGAEAGQSHPTVSRRVNAAVAQLQRQLRNSGIAVTALALGSLLSENAVQAAPPALLAELAKMALGGGANLAAAGGLLVAAKAKIVVVAAVVGVATVGLFTYRHLDRPKDDLASEAPVVETTPRDEVTVVAAEAAATPVAARVAEQPARADSRQKTVEGEPAAAASAPPSEQEQPQEQPSEKKSSGIDLTTPASTVRSFTKLMAAGDAEAVIACFLPGGIDFQDMQEILAADPADPRQRNKYEMRVWLQSFDADVEMPIVEMIENADGSVSITWQVTFKRNFAMEGQTFSAGQTMTLDASLVRAEDGRWLINGL